jgi:hypothetical protein
MGLVVTLTPQIHLSATASAFLGLCVAIAIGLGWIARAWRRYVAMLLCARGELSLRLVWVLKKANSVGMLRYSGIAYQFRHLELRDYFARAAEAQSKTRVEGRIALVADSDLTVSETPH